MKILSCFSAYMATDVFSYNCDRSRNEHGCINACLPNGHAVIIYFYSLFCSQTHCVWFPHFDDLYSKPQIKKHNSTTCEALNWLCIWKMVTLIHTILPNAIRMKRAWHLCLRFRDSAFCYLWEWCQAGDSPITETMMALFTDATWRH